MPQPGVEHFLDPAEFGSPKISHIVKALVDRVESRLDPGKLAVEERDDKSDQRRIEQHRNPDGEIELLVGHQTKVRSATCYSRTTLFPLPNLAMRVSIDVHFVFKNARDRVQAGKSGRRSAVINRASITDRAAGVNCSHASALPGGNFAILQDEHGMALTVQASIGPHFCPIRDDLV